MPKIGVDLEKNLTFETKFINLKNVFCFIGFKIDSNFNFFSELKSFIRRQLT